jgi:hypothetical protein
MTNNLARVLAGAAVALACALTATPALAAAPVKDGRYVGSGQHHYAELKVSKSGRSLVARGSTLGSRECDGPDVHLGSRRRPVRVSPSGRFSYERTKGRVTVRATGVFKAKNRARITVLYRDKSEKFRLCRRARPEKVLLRRIIPFRNCRTHPGETVLEGPRSRVFLSEPAEFDYRYAVACLYSVNKPVELGLDIDGDPDVGLYRLAGPYVAYAESSCEGLGPCLSDVFVRDLRTGKKVFEGPQGLPFDNVSDIALKQTGAVAWIARPTPGGYGSPEPTGPTTLWASDSQGFRELDSGGGVGLTSLELSGSTLTWVKDGVSKTATLD